MIWKFFRLQHEDSNQPGSSDNESSSRIPFWTALGWTSIPTNSAAKQREGVCEYSPDISYVEESPGVVRFKGFGVLRGQELIDLDDPEDKGSYGIINRYNCFGELTCSCVDSCSIWYMERGDVVNPNTWLKEAILDKDISEVDTKAFQDCINLCRLTIEGKQTILLYIQKKENLTICAPVGSLAEEYAKSRGIPFEPI